MKTLQRFWQAHPDLTSFLALAIGMLVILYFSARHVGFSAVQWLTLGVATVALAALSIWIISWEDEPAEDEPEQ